MKPTRVMVVDDSAVVRQVLGALLGAAPGIELMAAVSDPLLAIERMKTAWPDVIVLDVEMPRMDGITFLKKLMAERPTPVVICSSLTQKGAETTLQALAAGAVTIIAKPTLGLKTFLQEAAAEVVAAVRGAARANLRALAATPRAIPPRLGTDAVPQGVQTPQQIFGEQLYEIYYRFLETEDEYFDYAPARVPPQGRWKIYGLGLPEQILRKVYHQNAERLLGLR